MVDFPDSPAPVLTVSVFLGACQRMVLSEPTQQKHLDLITLKQLITFELVLNLLIALLSLLLLGAHSATHLN